jgi:hypothetical protein
MGLLAGQTIHSNRMGLLAGQTIKVVIEQQNSTREHRHIIKNINELIIENIVLSYTGKRETTHHDY